MMNCRLYPAVLMALTTMWCLPLIPQTCLADLVVDLPEVTVYADGVNPTTGSFEVFLTLIGDDLTTPPDLSSFNLQFTVVSSDITFDDAIAPMSPPLFTTGTLMNFSADDPTVQAAHDIFSESPSSLTTFDGAALIKVPFTVVAGTFGTFSVNFGSLNEFTDAGANSLAASFINGSITVAAIPEVGTWKLFGLISAIVAMKLGVRKRSSLTTCGCSRH